MDAPIKLSEQALEASATVLLITANVGSLFEDPTRLLRPWLGEFLTTVSQLQPQFIALHLQEVGGKTYEKSLEHVQDFINYLCEAKEMQEFCVIRVYMDEDFNSAEHFTALGNLYLAHQSLSSVRLWNFLTHDWEPAVGKTIYSGNIEAVATKEKAKFPQHFFPECKWSRKGFMRTRWEINNTVIDLVNIHLFHDASNLAACEEFPSVYCKTRRRALVHTLERFHLDEKNCLVPFFVFGDFNFRCDTEGVIKELTEDLTAHRVESIKNDSTKVHYRNSTGDNVLTVGKKEFNHADHQLKFKETWLKKFDRELEELCEFLLEYPINFPPSYPYEEDPEMPTDYMSTRCPSWCDRILMSPQARKIIDKIFDADNPYNIIGHNVCMGDHKPVYLNVRLKANQGTYRCCNCCFSAKNNNNKSTSHSNSTAEPLSLEAHNFCPHNSVIYYEVLAECRKLNKKHGIGTTKEQQVIRVSEALDSSLLQPELGKHVLSTATDNETITKDAQKQKHPSVSINIIDSDNLDNISVCMCAQQKAYNDGEDGGDGVDGTICSKCCNIIKMQLPAPRYRIIAKRLMFSNDIIVNHIDTQYLNTHYDVTVQRQDPYTPESVESHSPNPEPNSSSTNTSSCSSRGPCSAILREQQIHSATLQPSAEVRTSRTVCEKEVGFATEARGIVLPGQLKLRLEDLQRSSMHCLGRQKSDETDGSVGDCDVDDDDVVYGDSYQPANADLKRRDKSCLPQCCTIH